MLVDGFKARQNPESTNYRYNAVNVAELAIEKGATTLLIPISARRQLNELSDDMAVKISILFYADAREALIKALGD
ncbi:MAG: hypothetical protein ACJ788_28410 [Ktedonobacteraceae bacterium]